MSAHHLRSPEGRAEYFGRFLAAQHDATGSRRDAPLSGEWADETTPRDVCTYALGRFPTDDDADTLAELCDAFEEGYFG